MAASAKSRAPHRSSTGKMKRSLDRILTTHVGSLIRPQPLQALLRAKQAGKGFDRQAHEKCLADSVTKIVRRQAEAGIDVVSDGEFGKIGRAACRGRG